MGLDPLSAIAPARVKVLIIPLGRVRQSRFSAFVARLQQEHVVRLGDVSPDGRPHRTMFSPLAFPTGSVLYDLSTSLPLSSHLALAPFELYREPLVVVAIADGADLAEGIDHKSAQIFRAVDREKSWDNLTRFFSQSLEKLQVDFPKALVHQIAMFDSDTPISGLPDGVYTVPSPQKSKTTTIKTLMCDLTSSLLAEMTTYAKSLQAMPTLESPKQLRGSVTLNGYAPNSTSSPPKESADGVHRMSIPAQRPSTANSRLGSSDGQETSTSSAFRKPPTTFDDITGAHVKSSSPQPSHPSNVPMRPESQDSMSMHGFGAGSIGERERNKGRGRVGVVIGSLYLLAGRWPDAVRELTESAIIARTNTDHLWHAKALDYIMVCLLMYAWANMDFRIPQILFPGVEKPGSNSRSSSHTQSNSVPDLKSPGPSSSPSRSVSLQSLIDLLPDLVNNILNLYARAWTFTEDKLPQLALSESTIRFTKLLALINLSGGVLDDDGLSKLVLNADGIRLENIPRRLTTFPTKAELTTTLFRAFPAPSTSSVVPIEDRTMILAAIASVLSELGYHRKKALVLKELLSALIPALVQARKEGAAEMGFHPAASLASLKATVESTNRPGADAGNEFESGLQSFLTLICHVYGVYPFPSISSDNESKFSNWAEYDMSEAIEARIVQQAALKFFGSRHLKLDVLRSCIDLCEALPDLGGVLRFSAEMLRTAGSGIAPGPASSGGSPSLPMEDQAHLAANISRTVNVARQVEKPNLEAEYWDEFLVRAIEHVRTEEAKAPVPHARADLEAVNVIDTNMKKNPFIYNPFMKSVSSNVPDALIVAQEDAVFRVTLQNLYDLDIEIERISLESRGLPFDSSLQRTLIGPYETRTVVIAGVPRMAGSLSITGCKVKVKGCRERSFPVFNEAWKPKAHIKISRAALGLSDVDKALPASNVSEPSRGKKLDMLGPSTFVLTMNVIEAQPNVVMKHISLPQSAIMLLEGETKMFSITLQNTTPVAADMLFLSFTDSTTPQLRPSSTEKEPSASESYELEYASLNKQSFRWRRSGVDENIRIEPNGERMLEIEALGKPGLSFGTIQVSYGHLGDVASKETTDQFYTRLLNISLAITVNASVELVRNDLTPFTSDFAWQNRKRRQSTPTKPESPSDSRRQSTIAANSKPSNRFQSLLARIGLNSQEESHCLLLLDLRNSWPSPLTISIEIRSLSGKSQSSAEPWERAYTVHEPIQPGHTSRILLLIPRIYIANSHATIPSLAPDAKKRQFILSTGPKPAPEAELATREAFHYREALLSHVRATWEEESTHRTGSTNLRALHLTTRMVSALRLDDLEIALSIHSSSSPSPSSPNIQQLSPSRYVIPTSEFLSLRTTLTNRSSDPIHPLLRLQPALKDQPHNIALDISKKFLWNGVLQQALPELAPGASRAVDMDFVVLCPGVFEIGAVAEEVQVLRRDVDAAGLGADPERRIWGLREPCVLVARDAEPGNVSNEVNSTS
ncbi:hypothetical protein MMC07_001112 [Pseudocyphellaria aurata]|nr:hypothetical protein [Pseudocyphellaria aurata]